MRFGHYCVFQCPPWQEPWRVLAEQVMPLFGGRGR